MSANDYICESEKIASYIDGDLDAVARSALEEHIKQCERCNSELQAQRLFMCELNSALANPFDMAVPANFAQVVAVHAESDMRGVRSRAEHTRALRFCLILGMGAFALLGVTSSKAVISSVQSFANKTLGIVGLFVKAIYDAAAGFAVIVRVLSRGLISDSRFARLTGLLIVGLAVGLLSLLIARYHRTRLID